MLNFDDIESFSYGSGSLTFERHQASVHKKLRKKRKQKLKEEQDVAESKQKYYDDLLLVNELCDSGESSSCDSDCPVNFLEDEVNQFEKSGVFYPWECISIIRKDQITVDFHIPD